MTTHKVTLKMKDPSFEKGGETFPGDLGAESETVWHVDPNQCVHKNTLCIRCVQTWTYDNWATIHFGPDTGVEPPSYSLNELVELQASFIACAQLLATAVSPLFDTAVDAAAQVAHIAAAAVRETPI
jgi:hypothetical protein